MVAALRWVRSSASVAACALAVGVAQAQTTPAPHQPIIDVHRHTPWPGESDVDGLAAIHEELVNHGVVAAVLFITGQEDLQAFPSSERVRFILSPMFPCPALTDARDWCFTESEGDLPDPRWVEEQLATGALGGIGELVFNYAAMSPTDPAMVPYWDLAARYDVPAFVHTGRGPGPGQGPRRYPNCCPGYDQELGNPDLLRPILERHPGLRVSLQHVGFDFLDETIGLLRDYPNVYLDMSVLNSVGPEDLHAASLRSIVEAGFSSRIMLGSDDQDLSAIIARIEGATFLAPEEKRGIYHDNAARFLRLDLPPTDAPTRAD